MEANNEFIETNGMSDIALIVEDHKIPLCKSVLCIASPVFRAMFESDFEEKTKHEIPLPGKRYEDFAEFLRCIYPNMVKEVTETNVYMILPLAHEFDVKIIVKRCQDVLVQLVRKRYPKNAMELLGHIKMSETYNLQELEEKCIYLASEDTLEHLKDARKMHQISDSSYCRIVEIALRRYELNKEDDGSLPVACSNVMPNSRRTIENLSFQLHGKIDFNLHSAKQKFNKLQRNDYLENTKCILKAVRLIERFNITVENRNVRSDLLKMLKKEPLTEEFDLLPESIKSAL